MNNNFGIYDRSYFLILETLKNISEIEKAYIFGSRAMGNYKKGSDIDIAIMGEKLNFNITSSLYGLLNEKLPIPYVIDLVNFNIIETKELKEHILNEGKIIHNKEIQKN